MLFELHVANDFWPKRTGGMREDGRPESWMKFFGDRGAADLIAAFEHERLESRLSEIKGRDQAVVPAADNDDVARVRHRDSPGSVDFEERRLQQCRRFPEDKSSHL